MKRLIIYDMDEENAQKLSRNKDDIMFAARPAAHNCVGCFSCWIKTPGVCVINDRCSEIPLDITSCDEMWLISELEYGGHSKAVKTVLDRSIGYMLPYFRIVDGEMHHQMRYKHSFKLVSIYYGNAMDEEKQIARELSEANARNFGCENYETLFADDIDNAIEYVK